MADRAPTTRVLLFDVPSLLAGLVRDALDLAPDVELVGEADDAAALADAMDAQRPDVLILRAPDRGLPGVARDLFDSRPRLRVLALNGIGEQAILWQLAPHHESLVGVSGPRLLAAVREQQEWSWTA